MTQPPQTHEGRRHRSVRRLNDQMQTLPLPSGPDEILCGLSLACLLFGSFRARGGFAEMFGSIRISVRVSA